MDDDDRHDGRREGRRGVGFHGGARLSALLDGLGRSEDSSLGLAGSRPDHPRSRRHERSELLDKVLPSVLAIVSTVRYACSTHHPIRPPTLTTPRGAPVPTIPTFEMPKFELPKFELPTFEMPKFELPKFEMPKFEVPDLPSAEQITSFARDAAYVGVGLAAMTVERLQALQQQLVELLKERSLAPRSATHRRRHLPRAGRTGPSAPHALDARSVPRRRRLAAGSLSHSCPRRRPPAPRCPRAPSRSPRRSSSPASRPTPSSRSGPGRSAAPRTLQPDLVAVVRHVRARARLLPPARAGARAGARRTVGPSARAASPSSRRSCALGVVLVAIVADRHPVPSAR